VEDRNPIPSMFLSLNNAQSQLKINLICLFLKLKEILKQKNEELAPILAKVKQELEKYKR
jgi:hypothetical protein